VLVHEPLFESEARGSYHGLAATAALSREAGLHLWTAPPCEGLLRDLLAFDCLQSSIRSHRTLMGFAERHPNI
jgi:hypothetical protein